MPTNSTKMDFAVPPPTAEAKLHKVSLLRPSTGGFGFMVRGGLEYGVGIFVSMVEVGSEAHLQGLRVGDEILRVCGYSLDKATHQEVINVISSRRNLQLKVRSVGMIPVKNSKNEALSWRLVNSSDAQASQREVAAKKKSYGEADMYTTVIVGNDQAVGCCICKGPKQKPGIFVQSCRLGGPARVAGVSPGDQIIECNGLDFTDIDFADAVYHLKASQTLELRLRKGVGLDLLPSESSGYDSSSAGSSTEDTSSFRENNSSWRVRPGKAVSPDHDNNWLTGDPDKYKRSFLTKSDEKKNSKSDLDFKSTINGPKSFLKAKKDDDSLFKRDSKESKTAAEESFIEDEKKKLVEQKMQLVEETKMLKLEKEKFEEEKRRALIIKSNSSSSGNSLASVTSIESTNSHLANEINAEILKRAANKKIDKTCFEKINSKEMLKKPIVQTDEKHEALMAEFKRAHKKMFNMASKTEETRISEEEKVSVKVKLEQLYASVQKPNKVHAAIPQPPHKNLSLQQREDKFKGDEASRIEKVPLEKIHEDGPKTGQQNVNTPPGTPSPDYDSSPEGSPTTSRKRPNSSKSRIIKSSMANGHSQKIPDPPKSPEKIHNSALAKDPALKMSEKHQMASRRLSEGLEVGSLDSFSIERPNTIHPKPPSIYFEPTKPSQSLDSNSSRATLPGESKSESGGGGKTVRFHIGADASAASQDYRAANATAGIASRNSAIPTAPVQNLPSTAVASSVHSSDSLSTAGKSTSSRKKSTLDKGIPLEANTPIVSISSKYSKQLPRNHVKVDDDATPSENNSVKKSSPGGNILTISVNPVEKDITVL